MRFIADECVDGQIPDTLEQEGYNVIYIADLERSLSDEEIIQRANDAQAILITEDKDFGELIFRQHRLTHGIILLRLHGLKAEQKVEVVISALNSHSSEIENHFTVIMPKSIRIRILPQPE